MTDTDKIMTLAQAAVAARKVSRETAMLEHRGALAADQIADELALLRAELKMFRHLYATNAARR